MKTNTGWFIQGVILIALSLVTFHKAANFYGNSYFPTTTPEALTNLTAILIFLTGVTFINISASIKG